MIFYQYIVIILANNGNKQQNVFNVTEKFVTSNQLNKFNKMFN